MQRKKIIKMKNIEPIIVNGTCFFGADFHFGAPNAKISTQREAKITAWIDEISPKMQHFFLLGDIFDFWFERDGKPMPGYEKFIEKLIELRNKGVHIYYFTGNHDMWAQNFFPSIGIPLFKSPTLFCINGKITLLGHGDGLGSNSWSYAFIKWLFSRRWSAKLYATLPASWGDNIALYCSKKSRMHSTDRKIKEFNAETEHRIKYCRQQLEKREIDLFIFGHRHIPMHYPIKKASYFNVGDWLWYQSYVVFPANGTPQLAFYQRKI